MSGSTPHASLRENRFVWLLNIEIQGKKIAFSGRVEVQLHSRRSGVRVGGKSWIKPFS